MTNRREGFLINLQFVPPTEGLVPLTYTSISIIFYIQLWRLYIAFKTTTLIWQGSYFFDFASFCGRHSVLYAPLLTSPYPRSGSLSCMRPYMGLYWIFPARLTLTPGFSKCYLFSDISDDEQPRVQTDIPKWKKGRATINWYFLFIIARPDFIFTLFRNWEHKQIKSI